jgi:hypothetical protein
MSQIDFFSHFSSTSKLEHLFIFLLALLLFLLTFRSLHLIAVPKFGFRVGWCAGLKRQDLLRVSILLNFFQVTTFWVRNSPLVILQSAIWDPSIWILSYLVYFMILVPLTHHFEHQWILFKKSTNLRIIKEVVWRIRFLKVLWYMLLLILLHFTWASFFKC